MNFKAGILAAAAALTLAVPAVALAQPGRDQNFGSSYYGMPRSVQASPQRQDYSRGPGYAPPVEYRDDYRPDAFRDDRYAVGYRDDRADWRDWRREQAQREWRRMEYLRRMQWDRDHSYRGW